MMIRKGILVAALMGAALVVSGCPGDSGGSTSSSTGRSRQSGQSGQRAPSSTAARSRSDGGAALFRLPTADGQTVTVKTPAALFFFTSWCGYCKQVMPELKRLTERARSMGWRVYGVNVNEGPEQVNAFIQQYQPNFPVILDQQGTVGRQYGLKGYPTFVLIDQNANIIYNGHEVPRNF